MGGGCGIWHPEVLGCDDVLLPAGCQPTGPDESVGVAPKRILPQQLLDELGDVLPGIPQPLRGIRKVNPMRDNLPGTTGYRPRS